MIIINKVLKRVLLSFISLILIMMIVVGSYLEYVIIQYHRIDDNLALSIKEGSQLELDKNKVYTITTYNIGFGAYEHDYSFFMDEGEFKDGRKVKGKYSKAKSKESVLKNTKGSIKTIKDLNSDFMLFQEVDTNSTRSYKVNQYQMLLDNFNNYDTSFASNFHSAYILYPFNDIMGKANSGIATLSKYNLTSSTRYSFPVDESFPTRFFDLDRCFSVNRIKVDDNKELVIVNVHMSAYDKGGIIRQKQLKVLNEMLKREYSKGNYVIAGGDFNHDIANTLTKFESQQKVPNWVFKLEQEDLTSGFRFVSDSTTPSIRSTDIPYKKGVNYTATLDGFIVSDNIESISSNVIKQNDDLFVYSDHNPVKMEFKLK